MTETTTTDQLLTDGQLETLNNARTILAHLSTNTARRARDAPTSGGSYPTPYAQDYGRVSALAESAALQLFQVLNAMNSHGVQQLTRSQLHNVYEDEEGGAS